MSTETESFTTHFDRLKSIADELEKGGQADIKHVVDLVRKAGESRKVCLAYLDAGTRELDELLKGLDRSGPEA